MKFYITKISYDTEDGALPFIEGNISTEITDSLLKESAIKQMVEEYKEALKEEILKDIDSYIDFEDYVNYDDIAEEVADRYIDYEEIVNMTIEEIKERL